MYDRVKGENPTAKITEITKIISDMWQAVDPATKDRLEAEYRRNKEAAAQEKADYEQKYGKIERKKKKKRIDKAQKGEWFILENTHILKRTVKSEKDADMADIKRSLDGLHFLGAVLKWVQIFTFIDNNIDFFSKLFKDDGLNIFL